MKPIPVVATPTTSVLVPFQLCGSLAEMQLLVFESVVSLRAQLGIHAPHGILVELRDDARLSSSLMIRELRQAYPGCPIIGVVRALTRDRDLVPAAIAAGATDLALLGYEDLVSCVRRVCGDAGAITPEEEILRVLQPHVDSDVWPFISYAILTASRRLSADQVATVFGLSRSALARRVRKHGFKSVGLLIAFARALVAVALLQRGAAGVNSVAEELRFRTPYAFRVFLRKQFGARPAQLRHAVPIARSLEQFVMADVLRPRRLTPSLLLAQIARDLSDPVSTTRVASDNPARTA